MLAEVAEAGAADVDLAVRAARRAYDRVWSRMSGRRARQVPVPHRPHHARSARASSPCWRALDNGKPIKESRDVDMPLAAAYFFYYAGWADKLDHAGLGPDPQPLGVAGQVIPWNFPLLMLAWKIAPALACGNTVVLKPAETTPLTALLFAEICQQADLPPGVVNIVTGAGDDRPARWSSTPASTRWRSPARPRSARRSPGRSPAPRKRVTLELGGKARQHRVRRRADRPGRRGHRQRHLLQPGPRLLRRVATAGAGERRRRGRRPAEAAAGTLRLGDPLDKNTDIGAINSAAQLARITELVDAGEDEGATRWSPPCDAAASAGSGSPRRCSPASRRPTASPRRRSSARSCRC